MGSLIVNADDWGQDSETTDRILTCVRLGSVSSVSAMVFMNDSERAATIAIERGVDAGLHLNFTTAFSARHCPPGLIRHQERLAAFLSGNRYRRTLYNPRLASSFEYVVASQVDEFTRIYGTAPVRLDGHHHMHLCANVLFGNLLPEGAVVRRNFSFLPGEKSLANRLYRAGMDRLLRRRHTLVDYFFSLQPIGATDLLRRKCALAGEHAVELCAHPQRSDEFRFLGRGEIFRSTNGIPIALRYASAAPEGHPG